jgi:hypothetical protein
MGQGKEAVTVRQALLVIVLIASSFLGGAFVNGPGLRWAQTRLMRSLGLNGESEITSVDLTPAATPVGVSDSTDPAKPVSEPMLEPLAPAPTVLAEDGSSQKVPSNHRNGASSKLHEKPRDGTSFKTEAGLPLGVTPPFSVPTTTGSASKRLASPDSEVRPAGAPLGRLNSSDSKVEPALLDSLGTLLPSASSPPPEPLSSPALSPSSSPVPKPTRSISDDWIVLQQKLRALNVSRFTIEGEPSGRVLFSCLIPLAGRQAVTQRFEAEGDDMIQAVQATLRRIALWRATQPQPR